MKKLFAAATAFLMSMMFSVTAFAGAPYLFTCDDPNAIICTGGEGGIFVVIAIVLAVVAFIGGIVFFVLTGKKK